MKILVSERLSAHKYKTAEGYLVCTDAILARTGSQTYTRSDLFGDTCDRAEDEVGVLRDPKEVFSNETMASFENKALTIEHPEESVDSNNHKNYAVGFVRDIRKSTADGQDVMIGNIVITDKDAIAAVESGELTDLSCGYDCDIADEENPSQKNIRGNHVALCKQGRAGIARIIDATTTNAFEIEVMRTDGLCRIFSVNADSKEKAYRLAKEKLAKDNSRERIMSVSDSIVDTESVNDEVILTKSKIWNPDFYLKKEPNYDKTINDIRAMMQRADLQILDFRFSVYESYIFFIPSNMKLETKAVKNNLLYFVKQINNSLSVDNVRSYGGKITFKIVGYQYLQQKYKVFDSVNDDAYPKTKEEALAKILQLTRDKSFTHTDSEGMVYLSRAGLELAENLAKKFKITQAELAKISRHLFGSDGYKIADADEKEYLVFYVDSSDNSREIIIKATSGSDARRKVKEKLRDRVYHIHGVQQVSDSECEDASKFVVKSKQGYLSVGGRSWVEENSSKLWMFNSSDDAWDAAKKYGNSSTVVITHDAIVKDATQIKKGDRLRMSRRGQIYEKVVENVEGNYGSDAEPDWYLDFTDGSNLHQQVDMVEILSVNGRKYTDSIKDAQMTILVDIFEDEQTSYKSKASAAGVKVGKSEGKRNQNGEKVEDIYFSGDESALNRFLKSLKRNTPAREYIVDSVIKDSGLDNIIYERGKISFIVGRFDFGSADEKNVNALAARYGFKLAMSHVDQRSSMLTAWSQSEKNEAEKLAKFAEAVLRRYSLSDIKARIEQVSKGKIKFSDSIDKQTLLRIIKISKVIQKRSK